MEGDDDNAYRVEERDGRFHVLDRMGRTVLSCGDEASAIHYGVLLKEAYGRGYKAGYKEGRRRPGPGGAKGG